MEIKEFEHLIESIDEQLKNEQVPIHARPLHAIMRAGKTLRTEIIIAAPVHLTAIPNCYNKFTLGQHIQNWYKVRYGDRLKICFSPGGIAIVVRGDLWRLNLPLIYGTVELTCDPDLKKYEDQPIVSSLKKPSTRNVLNCIKDFPQGLASKLSIEERQTILEFFMINLKTLLQLKYIFDKPYIKEAKGDLDSAVTHLLENPAQYGLSKWESLQFAEKLLKSFLSVKKAVIPRIHALKRLATEAQKHGLIIDMAIITAIQCDAGVRYGEIPVTLKEAIDAHHNSLLLCRQIVQSMCITNTKIKAGCFYTSPSLGFHYYCEKIESNSISWWLLESYQRGKKVAAKFTSKIEDSKEYQEIHDKILIAKLQKTLESLKALG